MSSTTLLTEAQLDILNEFRAIVEGFLNEEKTEDDAFLLRWLIAREFNLEKSRLMLKNYVEWSEVNEIDKLLEWSPPDEMKDACPFEVLGYDFDNRPILLFPWGKWKPWILTERYLNMYQKYMDFMIQTVVAHMKQPVSQFIIIADAEGFTYGHMKYIKALEVNLEALKGFEAHYPELMHSAIAINCPKAFTVAFSLIKPLMSQRTRNKLSLFSCDKMKWKEFMAEKISQDQLPNKYQLSTQQENSE